MATTYKLISDLEGYRVGDDGSVWSQWVGGCKPRLSVWWKRLRPSPQYRGHLAVELGRGNRRFVHRLVLEVFVGPCPEGKEGCHNDGNPANNRVENLRWDTRKSNGEDRVRHGTSNQGELASRAALNEADVRRVVLMRTLGIPMKEVAKQFGVHDRTVQAIMYGRAWGHVTGFRSQGVVANVR